MPPPVGDVPVHPFDAVANGYDAAFTDRLLGRWLRAIVWETLADVFQPGDRVLELGCGTGEDAIWLAQRGIQVTATDASSEMLAVARRKAANLGATKQASFSQLDLSSITYDSELTKLSNSSSESLYDGAFSDFGALNCLEDRRPLAAALSRSIRSGGHVVLVVMGPTCPWEIIWHLVHLEPRTAFRRLRSGAKAHVGAGTVRVWYPSYGQLHAEFQPHFKVVDWFGLGLLLPPSAMGSLVDRSPRLFRPLASLDRRFRRRRPWRWLNDHYVVVLERA